MTNTYATCTGITRDSKTGKITYNFKFTFTNREQYLAFVKEWKQTYADLSAEIRGFKVEIRETMRSRQPAGHLQQMLRELKTHAHEQLQARAAAKIESARQRSRYTLVTPNKSLI